MKVRQKRRSNPKSPRTLPKVRIFIQEGRFQIEGLGAWYSYWRDPYHLLLTIPWSGFLGLTVLSYSSINALFALAYLAGGNSIENAKPGSFLDAFFFSVQTIASIGYGAMYPHTTYANIVVMLESMVGMMGIAVLTGLVFARFSQPTARVLFSQVAVIVPHEGIPTLMFRAANQRRNQILEAELRLYLMRDETTAEGYPMRRFHELSLVRSRTPSFTLSWTIMHPIDRHSPLYGVTAAELTQAQTSLVASLSGIDGTVSQVVHARYTYSAQDILWNQRFADIFHETPEGRYIDYRDFHKVVS